MELQLDTLIDKIKSNGIEEGQREAQSLVENAEKRAQEILANADAQAKQIVNQANTEAKSIIARGSDALKQAERDLLLTLEGKLKDLSNKFISSTSGEALSADKLAEIIKAALSSWEFGTNSNVFVHLSPEDANSISKSTLAGALKSGGDIEIKIDSSIHKGFRVSQSQGAFAFDFTSEAISEALSVFLTPNILELLR